MSKAQESKPSSDYTPEYMPSKETQRAIYLAGLRDSDVYFAELEKKVAEDIAGVLPTIGAIELHPLIKRAREIIQELTINEQIEGEHKLEISTELKDVSQEIAFKSTQWSAQKKERLIGAIFKGEPATSEASVIAPPDWDKEAKQ